MSTERDPEMALMTNRRQSEQALRLLRSRPLRWRWSTGWLALQRAPPARAVISPWGIVTQAIAVRYLGDLAPGSGGHARRRPGVERCVSTSEYKPAMRRRKSVPAWLGEEPVPEVYGRVPERPPHVWNRHGSPILGWGLLKRQPHTDATDPDLILIGIERRID